MAGLEQGALLNGLLGQLGSTCFDDVTLRIGRWFSILIVEDASFTTLIDSTRDGSAITGLTFTAGTLIHGRFTTIQLASGSCIAYKE